MQYKQSFQQVWTGVFIIVVIGSCKQPQPALNHEKIFINPKEVYPTVQFAFSQGVKIPNGGHTLYLAGLTAWDSNMQVVGNGDFEAQLRQCFKNIKAAVNHGGGKMSDVVRLTYFIKELDMTKAMTVVKLAKEFFPENSYPPGSLIGITRLVEDAFLVEVEATAVIYP